MSEITDLQNAISSVKSDDRAEAEIAKLEIEARRLAVESTAQDLAARKKFAEWIFWMVVVWLGIILAIVLAVGIGWLYTAPFHLSDAVVLGLIGSTTINVTAFFLVVTKDLFPGGKPAKSE